MNKHKTLNLHEKITISAALISSLIGYGRRAYAVCAGSGGSYVCSGVNTSPLSLSYAGNITVHTTADFSVNTSSGAALTITNTGASGGITFTNSFDSIITGTTGGIITENKGSGALQITTMGAVTATDGEGIVAFNSTALSTDLTIHAAGVTGTTGGIVAQNMGGGALLITATGEVAATNGVGVYAFSYSSSATYLTINAAGVSGTTGGIDARNDGIGALQIATSGEVIATSGIGIHASNDLPSTTDLMINAAGVSGTTAGISAHNNGTGALQITTTGEVTATNGVGIYAYNSPDSTEDLTITVSNGSVIQGSISGINAIAETSNMNIINNGTIQNLSTVSSDSAITTSGTGGMATITNHSQIIGTVTLENGTFINRGVWNTAGTNSFGANGTITNSSGGSIIAANNTITTPVTTSFNGLSTFNNAGTITMQNGVVGNKIIISGEFIGSGNSQIWLDTTLGPGDPLSDLIELNGGTASGSTSLIINNAGGLGAPTTADGIMVVQSTHGATTTSSAFKLGNRVAAGAYNYQLYYGGIGADANNQNWYLRNLAGPAGIRNEVPVGMIIPVITQQFGLTMLDTLDDRVGSKVPDPTGVDKGGIWGRVIGQTGKRGNTGDSTFFNHGPSYQWDIGGFQLGYDLYRRTHDNQSSDVMGVDLGGGHVNTSVNNTTNTLKAGEIRLDAYSFAAYWTHYAQNGWYSDAVLQGTDYTHFRAHSTDNENFSTRGEGYLASLESGWMFNFKNSISLTPEAQLIYQQIHVSQAYDSFGRFNFNHVDAFDARIGARVSKNWMVGGVPDKVITWGRVNLWRDFGPTVNTTVFDRSGANPVTFGVDQRSNWAQLSLGASGELRPGLILFTSGDVSTYFFGNYGQVFSGRIGAKYVYG